MTLLVRDEIDLIERNLEHHLSSGVDFIVATDNGSVDGTREVLARYQDKGLLYLIDEPGQDYAQATWVNRMGRLAYEEFGADFIFHCDADEFWYALSGDLTREIARGPAHAYKAHSFTVHLADRGGKETMNDAVYLGFETFSATTATPTKLKRKRRLNPGLGKVMTCTRDGYPEVTMGNHSLASGEPVPWSRDLYLLHYPIRSYEQFERKVVQGGEAVMRNPDLTPRQALHWREWYAHYRAGTLGQDYRALVIRDPEPLLRQGVLVDLRTLSTSELRAAVSDAIRRRTRRPPLGARVRRKAAAALAQARQTVQRSPL